MRPPRAARDPAPRAAEIVLSSLPHGGLRAATPRHGSPTDIPLSGFGAAQPATADTLGNGPKGNRPKPKVRQWYAEVAAAGYAYGQRFSAIAEEALWRSCPSPPPAPQRLLASFSVPATRISSMRGGTAPLPL